MKKCIVLSDTNSNSNKKAVLSLNEEKSGISGTVRLYNFPNEPDGILSLGIYADKQVYKAGLTLKNHMLYEFFVNLKNIPKVFSCAVVNFQNAEAKPVLFGSSEGNDDNIYGDIISTISENNSIENTKNTLDKYGVEFEEEDKKEIEKDIDDALCHLDCENCIYKKYFYENPSSNNVETESVKQENDLKEEKTSQKVVFFDKLKPQIDKLFENNPAENNLQQIFPSSKWVRVEYEDEGDFFVFGLIYDDIGQVKYVCYGVPSVYDEQPPEELDGYPIWLPLAEEKGFGYWMTYQDATTGEPIKAILD